MFGLAYFQVCFRAAFVFHPYQSLSNAIENHTFDFRGYKALPHATVNNLPILLNGGIELIIVIYSYNALE